jgi:hypothetical protein
MSKIARAVVGALFAFTAVAAPAVAGLDTANAAKVRGDGYWCC